VAGDGGRFLAAKMGVETVGTRSTVNYLATNTDCHILSADAKPNTFLDGTSVGRRAIGTGGIFVSISRSRVDIYSDQQWSGGNCSKEE